MIRKLALASVLSLSLAALAGGSVLSVAHAQPPYPYNPPQGSPDIGSSCLTTSYPASGNPYSLSNCNNEDNPGGGFFSNGAGEGPYNDLSGEGVHWTGTSGSYAHFLCDVPSIVTGQFYFTYSSAEIDISTSPTGLYEVMETCTVQTPDHSVSNLLAYFGTDTDCSNESQTGDQYSDEFDNNFFVTETPGGLATLHCNYYGYNEEYNN